MGLFLGVDGIIGEELLDISAEIIKSASPHNGRGALVIDATILAVTNTLLTNPK